MKVQEYQRTEKQIANQTRELQYVPDRSGEILGEAISRVGKEITSYADEKLQEANEIVADEAFSRYRQGHIDRAYGENGYQTRKGSAALGVTEEAMNALQKDYEKLSNDMSAKQLALFRKRALAFNDSVHQSMEQYSFEQGQAHIESSLLGVAQSSLEQAVAVSGDRNADIRADGYEKAKVAAENYYRHKSLSPDEYSSQMQKWESRFRSSVISKALDDNPGNPTKAINMFKAMKGGMTASDINAMNTKIKPYQDAFEIESLSAQYFADSVKRDMEENPGESFHHGRKIDVTKEVLAVQNSDRTPSQKMQLIHSIQFRANVINIQRQQEDNDLFDKVKDQYVAGVDVTGSPDFQKLTYEQQSSILSGAALKGSNTDSVNYLDSQIKAMTLTKEDYLAHKTKLTAADRKRYEDWINSSNDKRNREAQTYKLSDSILSKAVMLATGNKAKPSSSDFINLQANLSPIIREMIRKDGIESVNANTVASKIQEISKEYFKEKDVFMWFDIARNYNEIATRQREADFGRGKPVEVKDLMLVGSDNIPLESADNETMKQIISSSIQKAGKVPNSLEIARIWVKMQRSPNGEQRIKELINQQKKTGAGND